MRSMCTGMAHLAARRGPGGRARTSRPRRCSGRRSGRARSTCRERVAELQLEHVVAARGVVDEIVPLRDLNVALAMSRYQSHSTWSTMPRLSVMLPCLVRPGNFQVWLLRPPSAYSCTSVSICRPLQSLKPPGGRSSNVDREAEARERVVTFAGLSHPALPSPRSRCRCRVTPMRTTTNSAGYGGWTPIVADHAAFVASRRAGWSSRRSARDRRRPRSRRRACRARHRRSRKPRSARSISRHSAGCSARTSSHCSCSSSASSIIANSRRTLT